MGCAEVVGCRRDHRPGPLERGSLLVQQAVAMSIHWLYVAVVLMGIDLSAGMLFPRRLLFRAILPFGRGRIVPVHRGRIDALRALPEVGSYRRPGLQPAATGRLNLVGRLRTWDRISLEPISRRPAALLMARGPLLREVQYRVLIRAELDEQARVAHLSSRLFFPVGVVLPALVLIIGLFNGWNFTRSIYPYIFLGAGLLGTAKQLKGVGASTERAYDEIERRLGRAPKKA